jgi:conjugal transfer pilus assembly protein TraB
MNDFLEKWKELDKKYKIIFAALIIVGVILIFVQNRYRENIAVEVKQAKEQTQSAADYKFQALPTTYRNQGLEDLTAQISKLSEEVNRLRQENQNSAVRPQPFQQPLPPPVESVKVDLNKELPPAGASHLDFTDLDKPSTKSKGDTLNLPDGIKEEIQNDRPEVKVWKAEIKQEAETSDTENKLVIPVNSAIEAVMLSGINARPPGSISGAVGSVNSANDVGAPFVTRIKGDATLPNGWKLNDLGDCFLSGSGIAILSAERAYVISNTISCITNSGEVYEAPIKAYGLDIDGIQGISGKVVSKQGGILLQALLTGIVSGIGSALTPTAIPAYNSSAQPGSTQGGQYPDPNMLARTAVGTGINNAASQLSRFYLEFARETFPVIEIIAGTRVTWILKESVEFKKIKKAS